MKRTRGNQKVEQAVLGDTSTPIHQTYTASQNGGVMIGALLLWGDNRVLVSFALNGKKHLVSNALGNLLEYRKSRLDGKIKLKAVSYSLFVQYEEEGL